MKKRVVRLNTIHLLPFFNRSGLTLVELLVATSISGILIAAASSFYLNQHHQWMAQEQISDMQQSLRMGMNEVTRTIRAAGFGVLPGGMEPIEGSDSNPDTVTVRFNPSGCWAILTKSMPNVSSELKCDQVSCFEESVMVYIQVPSSHPLYPYGEWFFITKVQDGSLHIQHRPYGGNSNDLTVTYPAGSIIMMFEEVTYFIDTSSDPHHPQLMRRRNGASPQVYSEDIEDLNLTYTLADGSTSLEPTDGDSVRVVSVSLRARTAKKDQSWVGDNHRRRVLSSQVQLRNLTS